MPKSKAPEIAAKEQKWARDPTHPRLVRQAGVGSLCE